MVTNDQSLITVVQNNQPLITVYHTSQSMITIISHDQITVYCRSNSYILYASFQTLFEAIFTSNKSKPFHPYLFSSYLFSYYIPTTLPFVCTLNGNLIAEREKNKTAQNEIKTRMSVRTKRSDSSLTENRSKTLHRT